MKNKIKILHWFQKYYFYEKEKVPYYYFDLEISYKNRIKFILHNKWLLYVLWLLSALSFSICYYFKLRLFTYLMNLIRINSTFFFSNAIVVNVIDLVDKCAHNKFILFGLILLIIFIIMMLNYDYKTAYQLIIKIIYRRINYIVNLSIFLIIFDMSIVTYVEYNCLYLIIICIFIIKDIVKSIYYRRLCMDSIFCHFLSIPYFLILISLFFLWIQSMYFLPIFHYVLILNKKFFIISNYRDLNEK